MSLAITGKENRKNVLDIKGEEARTGICTNLTLISLFVEVSILSVIFEIVV